MNGLKRFFHISGTAAIMLVSLCGLFALLLAAGLLVSSFVYPFEQPLPYAVGLLLGIVSSMIKVVLMDRSINRSVELEGRRAQGYATLHTLLRTGVTILFMLLAVFLPKFVGVFGIILGILSLQFTAYIANAVLKKNPNLL